MASDHSHILTGESYSIATSTRPRRKKLILTITPLLTLFLLLVVVVAAVAITTTTTNHHKGAATSHALIRTSCSSTLYPDLCYSSLCSIPSLVDHRSVILSSIDLTVKALHHINKKFKRLYQPSKLTPHESAAILDCLEMVDGTLDELHAAEAQLRLYGGSNKTTLSRHACDLKTLLSAAMTNQQSCLEGFSYDDASRKFRKAIEEGVVHVEKMCSNSLAMIKNLTDGNSKSVECSSTAFGMAEDGFPEWMSEGDKRLLEEGEKDVQADVTVAKDGSGDFRTVTEAVDAAPEKSKRRFVIRIKAGKYEENVEVPKKKTYIMFVGDGRKETVITGRRNVVDGSTTFHSATVAVVGERFLARDITFENTAGPSKHQAVALRVGSDFSAFYRCDVLAYQDTLYVHSLRQFFRDCTVRGTVDFIFGNAAVVLQSCNLQARRPNQGQKNMFTAQGRDDPNQNTGISIQSCTLSAAPDLEPVQGSVKSYLGRPWKRYSRTVIMKSTITDVIEPEGWHEWSGTFAQSTCYYAEYQNTGAGADTSKRVNWKGVKVIEQASEALRFTPASFISGSSWLASTGFPFELGL